MCIVTLEDGTTYNIDTNSATNAKSVVDYKLRQRLEYRKIKSVNEIKGVICIQDKYYNSSNAYDGKELNCVSGWSYRW
jgi:hypothetical protein